MNKLNVKQFKKKLIRGLAYPELFYLPEEDEYEPMIIKILVTEENNEMTIGFYSGFGTRFSYPCYSYLDMNEEYNHTNNMIFSIIRSWRGISVIRSKNICHRSAIFTEQEHRCAVN